jgi:ABC-type sugar transport system ATPase subunit
VLIFDEPVNGLDPDRIHWVRTFMRALAAEGHTVLVSSHLMSEMALTADHLPGTCSQVAGLRRGDLRRELANVYHAAHTLQPWPGFGVMCLFVAIVYAIAWALLDRRDA